MKTLYLVRHAKSSWDYPHLADIDRPLNGRGKKNAPEMGRRLREKGILPNQLISSPAKRAYKTAKEIAKQLGYPEHKIRIDHDIYHAGQSSLLEVVRSQTDEVESLMLFGHNPGFTHFANALANESIANVPTAGIVAIRFDQGWDGIDYGDGELIFFDYPKRLS